MRVFIFDTETTGFPQKDLPLDQQPYILQFAGILAEIDSELGLKEIERIDKFVKPPIKIPFFVSQVHGIYDKDVENQPTFEEQANAFLKYLNGADITCGHNIEFDEEVINIELTRILRKGDYHPQKTLCTMKSTVDFCAIPGRGFGYKFPKLSELYRKLFDENFDGAHNAMVDVEATFRALAELIKRKVVTFEENKTLRLF